VCLVVIALIVQKSFRVGLLVPLSNPASPEHCLRFCSAESFSEFWLSRHDGGSEMMANSRPFLPEEVPKNLVL
jgi:hypothetical protein